MKTARIKVRSDRPDSVATMLSHRENFKAGNMTGNKVTRNIGHNRGWLPGEIHLPNHDLEYIVYSYNTPIAWVLKNGEPVIPDVKYSVTTSHHQGLCRVYL